MEDSARQEILDRLRQAPTQAVPERLDLPPLSERSQDREALIETFSRKLAAQTGVCHRVPDTASALEMLARVLEEEGVRQAMAATDEYLASLNLPDWGREHGFDIGTPRDYPDRAAYKTAVFDRVQAGITGADFIVAESGTLALIHDRDQARLISLAPIVHVVLAPVDRVVPAYEDVMESAFGHGRRPSHISLITGPSMTADIQATPFKGMHGPRRLIVILVERGQAVAPAKGGPPQQ
ncbi:MAG: lactate utilization protein [Proteobacteria bacterium]|nr:lactate utilization protein [Pseudomonadota bacterium]